MTKLIGELLEKAKQAASAEELLAIAKENGVALSEAEADAYFKELNHPDEQSSELSDDALEEVAGGCGSRSPRWDQTQGRWV